LKIENTLIFGFLPAFRGMRNPANSWAASDSWFSHTSGTATNILGEVKTKAEINWGPPGGLDLPWGEWMHGEDPWVAPEYPLIGPKDMKLACRLIRGGSEHRKFLRQIVVWADLTLPRYVWTELDTYKVGTVRDSCSTMYKLGTRPLVPDDFEKGVVGHDVLETLNKLGEEYRTTKSYDLVREMKQLLPEGFLQKATYSMNYENALNMYCQRRKHRLPEWNAGSEGSLCHWIAGFPYMSEFIEALMSKKEE
jgi:hypothetical protein